MLLAASRSGLPGAGPFNRARAITSDRSGSPVLVRLTKGDTRPVPRLRQTLHCNLGPSGITAVTGRNVVTATVRNCRLSGCLRDGTRVGRPSATRGGVNIGRVRLRGGVPEIDDLAGARTVDAVSGNPDTVWFDVRSMGPKPDRPVSGEQRFARLPLDRISVDN